MSSVAAARCAAHRDAEAVAACARCGDYLCAACADPIHPGVCVRCSDRMPRTIPWEDPEAGGWARRFFGTLLALVVRPGRAFADTSRPLARRGVSSGRRAMGFAALCGLALGAGLLAIAGLLALDEGSFVRAQARGQPAAFGVGLAFALSLPPLAVVLWALLQSVSLSLGLAAAGLGGGVGGVARRACGYGQGALLACVSLPLGPALLAAGLRSDAAAVAAQIAWVAATVLWPILTARIGYWAGRGAGLSGGRAAFAALGPSLLSVPIAAYVARDQLRLLVNLGTGS